MLTKAITGPQVPLLEVSEWVQGEALNISQLENRVILVEVFQVNCPGCFLYALPHAIELYDKYHDQGLTVIGIATAVEGFYKNTRENLYRLVETGELNGETLKAFELLGMLVNGRLPYKILFPLAMDKLIKRANPVSKEEIESFIAEHIHDFSQQIKAKHNRIWHQVSEYLNKLEYHAQTFEKFKLKGTPSHILVDKNGILRDCSFGQDPNLEAKIIHLLQD